MLGLIGGTGTVGRTLVACLLRNGVQPVLLARDALRVPAQWIASGVSVRRFDLDALQVDEEAFDGLERLFVLANPRAGAAHLEARLAQELGGPSLQRVVRISVMGADPDAASPVRGWHGRAEAAWNRRGWPVLHLRANFFMQSLLKMAPGVARRGTLALPAPTGRVSLVDARDLAECAALALLDDRPAAGVLTVTGPQAFTFEQVAARIAAHTGSRVAFDAVERSVFVERLSRQPGMEAAQAELIAGIHDDIEAGSNARVSDDHLPLLGRAPHTLDEFLRAHQAAFSPATTP